MATPDISLGGWFAARTRLSPDRPVLTFEGRTWTYRQLLDRADALATALRNGGIGAGDRIGFLGENQPAFLETFLAATRLGAIFVPLNFRLAPAELSFIVQDAGIHTLIVDGPRRLSVEPIIAQLSVSRYVTVDAPEGNWEWYPDLISGPSAGGLRVDVPARPADPEEVALIMYTSGTTGRPKGVVLTHANLWWSNTNMLHSFDVHEDDVSLVTAPLFHIAGLNVTTFTTLQKGGRIVLHRNFDAQSCLDTIERQGINTMFGVPAMFLAMSQHPNFADADLSSLRMVICGGAPVPEALLRTYQQRGVSLLQGYGLTETSPSATLLTAEYALAKLGSAGKPPMFTEVEVVDAAGDTIVVPFEQGEVCVRGANVTRGYWNRPEETDRAIDPAGWFHTGDVGYFDRQGFLFVVDRIKDMIISGGENVYPAEVENILYGHPAIAEVAVVGLPDERWGEAVSAFVVTRDGYTITLEELREFGARSLARYKLPIRLHLTPALPRNPSGKILKFRLRDQQQVNS